MSNRLRRLVIIGAGGFARELAWLVRDINRVEPCYDLLGFVVSDLRRLCERDSREQILGDYEWIDENLGKIDALAIGIGKPAYRRRVAGELEAQFSGLDWPTLIHPTAQFDSSSTRIGRGAILCAGVIATVNVTIEPFCMVNLACTIGHEAWIGKYDVLNPGANISGGVHLGEEVLVGTGAQILQYVQVGDKAKVSAGAVVMRNVAAGDTVVGVPARRLNLNGFCFGGSDDAGDPNASIHLEAGTLGD
jgi:sugar O-acyltransferase (sialic acid O-acetyltransferase NeuD family)